MLYGIPTLMAYSDIDALTSFCAENGFGFVEMNMTFPWFQSGSVTADTIRALTRKYGVGFTIHLHDQVNPFEFSPDLRRGSIENVRCAIDLACELGIPRLSMHLLPGTNSAINGVKTYLYDHCENLYLDYVRQFRAFVKERLKDRKTVFCIENTSGYHSYHKKAIEILLESDVFGLTYDIGHDYRIGGKDQPFILAHKDRLCHFHIHDCDEKSNHLGLGEGRVDLMRYLKLAQSLNATVLVEVKEAGALLRSKDYLIAHGMWNT